MDHKTNETKTKKTQTKGTQTKEPRDQPKFEKFLPPNRPPPKSFEEKYPKLLALLRK